MNTKQPWQTASIEYKGFRIAVKLDFGTSPHWIDGMPCTSGYVVTYGSNVNVMPGATWFQTVREAKDAIDIFLSVAGGSVAFWSTWSDLRREVNRTREDFHAARA